MKFPEDDLLAQGVDAILAAPEETLDALLGVAGLDKRTDLVGADLSDSDLAGVDFSGCDLTGVDFDGSNLKGARFVAATLAGTSFRGANLSASRFERCDLSAADFSGAETGGMKVRNCSGHVTEPRSGVPTDIVRVLSEIAARSAGTLASEYGRPYRGITTGANEAFLVDYDRYTELTVADRYCANILVPCLSGRDVGEWSAASPRQWLVALFSSHHREWPWSSTEGEAAEELFASTYPSIYEHLLPFKAQLMARKVRGPYWWELRTHPGHEWSGLLSPRITRRARFAWSVGGVVVDGTVMVIPGDPALLGLLNSGMGQAWVNSHARPYPGFLDLTIASLASFPVPDRDDPLMAEVAALVQDILALRQHAQAASPKDAAWRSMFRTEERALRFKLDHLVMRLYGIPDATYEQLRDWAARPIS